MQMPLSSLYDRNEKEKKRKYNRRVMTVEQGTFQPLVFSVFGIAAPECLCVKVADKRQDTYSNVKLWAILVCLRGAQTKQKGSYITADFNMDCQEANIGNIKNIM